MGIDEKQIDSIIEAHTDTVDGLKSDRDKYKEQAQKVPDLQKQLEEAKSESGKGDEWQQKYENEHKAFEDFKAKVQSEKSEADKARAYRKMLESAGIDSKRLDAIMRVTDLSGIEVEDGKLKDADKLTDEAKKEWADFIVKTKTQAEPPATPPKSNDAVEGADPDVVKRLQARHERLYGKTAEDKE